MVTAMFPLVADEKKRKVGFYLPQPVIDAFEAVAARVKGNEKSVVACAAILALAEANEETQKDLITRVQQAEMIDGSYAKLMAKVLKRYRLVRRIGVEQPAPDEHP